MFLWYKRAEICFAYLSDVRSPVESESSRWLTRGWTLQELIAPAPGRVLQLRLEMEWTGWAIGRRWPSPYPAEFGNGDNIMDDDPYDKNHTALHPITLHPHGVTFRAVVGPATCHLDEKTSMKTQLVILNCCFQTDPLARLAFFVTVFDGLLARLEPPLLRALPSPGEGAVSVQSEVWGPGPGPGGKIKSSHSVCRLY